MSKNIKYKSGFCIPQLREGECKQLHMNRFTPALPQKTAMTTCYTLASIMIHTCAPPKTAMTTCYTLASIMIYAKVQILRSHPTHAQTIFSWKIQITSHAKICFRFLIGKE